MGKKKAKKYKVARIRIWQHMLDIEHLDGKCPNPGEACFPCETFDDTVEALAEFIKAHMIIDNQWGSMITISPAKDPNV